MPGFTNEATDEERERVAAIEAFLAAPPDCAGESLFCSSCWEAFRPEAVTCTACEAPLVAHDDLQAMLRKELQALTAAWWFAVAVDRDPGFFDALVDGLVNAGLEPYLDFAVESRPVDFDPLFGYWTNYQRKLHVVGARLPVVAAVLANDTLASGHPDALAEAVKHWATYGQIHWGKMIR